MRVRVKYSPVNLCIQYYVLINATLVSRQFGFLKRGIKMQSLAKEKLGNYEQVFPKTCTNWYMPWELRVGKRNENPQINCNDKSFCCFVLSKAMETMEAVYLARRPKYVLVGIEKIQCQY